MESTSKRRPKAAPDACCAPAGRLHTRATQPYAPLFRALGDETRLEIVGLLAARRGKELCACEIEHHFELAQPTVSHHLKVLREAGIVTSQRRGTWVYYALDLGTVERFRAFQALLDPARR